VSGTVYHGGKELTDLNTKVYEMSAWTNPLHPDVFPGVCKMEGEIVRIVAELFHGGSQACGSVRLIAWGYVYNLFLKLGIISFIIIFQSVAQLTSGGTESIILAVKAYRDMAMTEKGILNPEILVPVTAHAAFDKAALLLNIGIKHVPINLDTCTVDVKAMKRMITKNTVMVSKTFFRIS
jgi:sphinganine-1-phosphate aldolase